MQSGAEYVFPKLLSIWVQLDEFRGMHPAGSGVLDVCALAKSAVDGICIELAGCIFVPNPTAGSETTPVELVIQPVTPDVEKQKLRK